MPQESLIGQGDVYYWHGKWSGSLCSARVKSRQVAYEL